MAADKFAEYRKIARGTIDPEARAAIIGLIKVSQDAEIRRVSEHKPPALTVDCVVFHPTTDKLLLIRRKHHPFQDQYALPGGFVEYGETTEQAAARELLEETGLVAIKLVLIGVYSEPQRDPRQHVISIAYLVCVSHYDPQAGDDAAEAEFVEYYPELSLAFDHNDIVNAARNIK